MIAPVSSPSDPAVRLSTGEAERQAYSIAHIREKRDNPKDVLLDLEFDRDVAFTGGTPSGGKTGKRFSSRRMSSARYNYGPAPSAHRTAGAFGREVEG